jgi:hypothetical protein
VQWLSFIVNARLRLCDHGAGRAPADHCVRSGGDALRFSVPGSVPVPTAAVVWRASFIGVDAALWLHYAGCTICGGCPPGVTCSRGCCALGAASFSPSRSVAWVPALVIGRGVFILASTLVVAVVPVGASSSVAGDPGETGRALLIVGTAAAVDLAGELFDRRAAASVSSSGSSIRPAEVGSPVISPGIISTVSRFPTSSANDTSIAWWSAWPMLVANCRWTRLLAMKLNQGVRFDHLASVRQYREDRGGEPAAELADLLRRVQGRRSTALPAGVR